MNIVKLKDVIMPKEFGMSDFFNKNLKGRYAYWIQMRYIFPLESLCYGEYIRLEQSEPIDFLSDKMPQHIDLYSEEYCMIDFVKEFVDLCATEEANNVYNYIASNEYVTDADIDMSKIRIFRTWLAKEILALDKDMYDEHMGKLTTEQIYMLEFYRNGMYNDVLKQLELFGSSNAKMNTITNTSSCGCCNNTISLYDLSSIDSCNATAIYVSNIHKIMVETFEQPSFWINLKLDFIRVFKNFKSKKFKCLKSLSLHTKIVVFSTIFLILFGGLFILAFEYNNPLTIKNLSFFDKIQVSFFQSVTTRTAGFASIPQENLTKASTIISLILMFIGGSPVGTAGGIKTITFVAIFAVAIASIRNKRDVELFNRTLSSEIIRKAVAVTCMSLTILVTSTILLSLTTDVNLIDVVYETTSATATVGLSRNLTPYLNIYGKIIIIFTMYLGRVGPISLAIAFKSSKAKTNIIKNPTEDVSVG